MFFFDPLYLLFAAPGLLLAFWAQSRVKVVFAEYSEVGLTRRQTGAQIARNILQRSGLNHVNVERTDSFLGDHYDPQSQVLRLSPKIYDGYSITAAGVAAHEAGHALQDQHNYAPLQLRTNIVPAVQVGGWVGPLMLMAGLFISPVLAWVGVLLFGLTVIFSLVTLPVEFDASKRARQLLSTEGIIVGNEMDGVNKVLNAAALTYVAAAIQAIGQLAYYVFMLMGNSDD